MHEVWSFKSPSNPDRRCMAFRTWPEYITNITTDVLYRWTWLQKPQRGGDVDPASQWRRARIFRQSLKAPQSIRRATSQEVLMVKNPPASAGEARDTGSAPGLGGSSEVGCGHHSSMLAWKIPEKPGRLQSMGPQRFGHVWAHPSLLLAGKLFLKEF